ncbi:MAG: hypothetical protein JWR27_2821 [Aeromicrobium sp.]|jgi:hypothetical protein|nr:hypothetical protein [Aeromicrobium sp.]
MTEHTSERQRTSIRAVVALPTYRDFLMEVAP